MEAQHYFYMSVHPKSQKNVHRIFHYKHEVVKTVLPLSDISPHYSKQNNIDTGPFHKSC